jgi:hypothetical protein
MGLKWMVFRILMEWMAVTGLFSFTNILDLIDFFILFNPLLLSIPNVYLDFRLFFDAINNFITYKKSQNGEKYPDVIFGNPLVPT